MNLLKEINRKFNKSDIENVFNLLNDIDFTRLSNDKSIIQSSLIQLSQGKIDSLYMYLKLIYKKEDDVIQAATLLKENSHHIDDIKISEDEYIKWIPLESNVIFINIDNLLANTYDFWDSLSTECVFECCGINACNFTSDTIIQSIHLFDKIELLKNFNDIILEINLLNADEVYSNHLNQRFNKNVFLELLQHIEFQIKLSI
ncbi:DUF6331 family protein [Empedobacter falsenii]|uniref:Uncharacterized protein n=1 Tax=Empedobacter falsenii TaxID=343874 RepID=A0AAW7DEZ2_9FLAO|nr:DUF6331 family protein [Empedobacter falsenii]MDM1550130.1 hypothetical protein [Empedobacter falsenii]